jgi:hypothetical protein
MPRYGHAQTLGFSGDVQNVFKKEKKSLKRAGVDAETVVRRIRGLHDRTASLNARQESLKRQLRQTTVAYVATQKKLYVVCSGAVDTAMAALEKNSPAAKNIQRLRSRIRKPRGPAAIPPPPPPETAD